MNDLYENTNYTNNNDKIDINKINIQYYDFLKNLVDKNNFEQQQDINNFSNLLNNTNNTNDNINNANELDKKILSQTKKELIKLHNDRCQIIQTDHQEDFKNTNKFLSLNIINFILDILKKFVYYTVDIIKTILNCITCFIIILIFKITP